MSILIEKTLFGDRDMVQTAIDRVKTMTESDSDIWVAFSGGKDSIVLKDIVLRALPNDDRVSVNYAMTTIDPPPLIQYMKKHHKECYGGETVLTGTRWAESPRRKNQRKVCEYFKHKKIINPIVDWSDEQVWEYIRSNNLPYCKLYDPPYNMRRIGCVMCPRAGNKERAREAELFPAFKKVYRKFFKELHKRKTEKGHTAHLRWENGDDMFEWWLYGDKTKPEQDCGLFQ